MSYGEALRSGFDRLSRYDASLFHRARRRQHPWVTRVMTALTHAGDAPSWIAHAAALAVIAGAAAPRAVALLAAGALIATAVSQLLKRAFCRPRPTTGIRGFVALAEDPDAFSFPSGHTAVAFGVAAALVGFDARLAAAEALWAAAIGCSPVYLGAHYPADVVAGAVVGVASGVAAVTAIGALLG